MRITNDRTRQRIQAYLDTHKAVDCTSQKIAIALDLHVDVVAAWMLVILSQPKKTE